ncbi:type II toxin-antitoxin system RelE/ParE family toxin [Rhodopirellula bahusiensis]|uniref:Plasmid stabilization protein n=1 Tax=Rhodopirellula bahusiensis TaxID=2014065 RepID=A0A2G1W2Y3_9BACT|nr:plasmid stabilization protein [Rhodopirellula bahusiensis]
MTQAKCLVLPGERFENALVVRPASMTSVIVLEGAERDYSESLAWYAKRSTGVAEDFDIELDRAFSLIDAEPTRYPKCDARHRFFLLRRFPFRVIYRIERDAVVVVAVAHGSRVPSYWSHR